MIETKDGTTTVTVRPAGVHHPSVLVLDADSGSAVEVLQSLAAQGVNVDVAGQSGDLGFASRLPRQRLEQPEDLEEFVPWLREADTRNGYTLIVASERTIATCLADLSAGDPLREKACLPVNEALRISADVARTQALARELGIRCTAGTVISSGDPLPRPVRFPLLLTPATRFVHAGGRVRKFFPIIVEDEEQRRAQLSYLTRHATVLECEFVPGKCCQMTFLYEHGERRWYFANEPLHELSIGGPCSYRRTVLAPERQLDDATRLLDALEWHGFATVEFLRDRDGGFVLYAVRPGIPQSMALIRDAGADLPAAILRVAAGEPVPPQPSPVVPYATRSLRDDVPWIVRRVRSGHVVDSLAEALKALLPFGESWENFEWNDLPVTRAILGELWMGWWSGVGRRLQMSALESQARALHRANLEAVFGPGTSPRRLLFLCYGNICRSPVAAALARRTLPGLEVRSAGLGASEGRRSPDNIQWAAAQMDLDSSCWQAALVSEDMVAEADAIFLMDLENLRDFRHRFRKHLGKALFLGQFGDPPQLLVQDPYQRPPEETIRVLRQIESAIAGVAKKLLIINDGISDTRR